VKEKKRKGEGKRKGRQQMNMQYHFFILLMAEAPHCEKTTGQCYTGLFQWVGNGVSFAGSRDMESFKVQIKNPNSLSRQKGCSGFLIIV
jgi:hypothetical protein